MTAKRKLPPGLRYIVLMTAIGLFLLWVGIGAGCRTFLLHRDGIRAEATVTGFAEMRLGGRGRALVDHAVVTFTDTRGQRVEFMNETADLLMPHRVGDVVPVLYIESPVVHGAIDRGPLWDWIVPLLYAAPGLLLLAAAVSVLKDPYGQKDGADAAGQ